MKFRPTHFFLIILVAITSTTYAQQLAAYIDYMDRFYVFDNGENIKVEDLKPQSFKVGGECILYINNQGHLKMYHKGNVSHLEVGGVNLSNYHATDHLASYNVYEKLTVVSDGKPQVLSTRCPVYQPQDSIVAFYDKNLESLRVFYKGEVQDIESGMIGTPINSWESGDNTVAYISSRTNDFKIWYRGEVHIIQRNVAQTMFKAGQDIVAYVDPLEENFKAFYKGEEYILDNFAPKSFKMGDGFVAFIDNMGEFKYFGGEEVETISSVAPEAYLVEDYSLAFVQDGQFWAWHNNTATEVEGWVPSTYKLDWNTIAYVDNSRRIWIFQNGERKYLTNDFVNSFEIYRDLIHMNVKVNRNIIYYNDKFYDGEKSFK